MSQTGSSLVPSALRGSGFCGIRALTTVDGLIGDLEILQPAEEREPGKLLTAVHEFDSYLRANAARIPGLRRTQPGR